MRYRLSILINTNNNEDDLIVITKYINASYEEQVKETVYTYWERGLFYYTDNTSTTHEAVFYPPHRIHAIKFCKEDDN